MNDAKLTIFGNLSKDPKYIENEEGKFLIANVAVTTKRKLSEKEYLTNFYTVTVRGKQAEIMKELLQKNTFIWVTGDLYVEPKVSNGNTYYKLALDATDIRVISNMKERERPKVDDDEDDTI